jgi:hypothetical protein
LDSDPLLIDYLAENLDFKIILQIWIKILIFKLILWIQNQSELVPDPGIPFSHTNLSNALKKTILVHILSILSSTNNFTTTLRTK